MDLYNVIISFTNNEKFKNISELFQNKNLFTDVLHQYSNICTDIFNYNLLESLSNINYDERNYFNFTAHLLNWSNNFITQAKEILSTDTEYEPCSLSSVLEMYTLCINSAISVLNTLSLLDNDYPDQYRANKTHIQVVYDICCKILTELSSIFSDTSLTLINENTLSVISKILTDFIKLSKINYKIKHLTVLSWKPFVTQSEYYSQYLVNFIDFEFILCELFKCFKFNFDENIVMIENKQPDEIEFAYQNKKTKEAFCENLHICKHLLTVLLSILQILIMYDLLSCAMFDTILRILRLLVVLYLPSHAISDTDQLFQSYLLPAYELITSAIMQSFLFLNWLEQSITECCDCSDVILIGFIFRAYTKNNSNIECHVDKLLSILFDQVIPNSRLILSSLAPFRTTISQNCQALKCTVYDFILTEILAHINICQNEYIDDIILICINQIFSTCTYCSLLGTDMLLGVYRLKRTEINVIIVILITELINKIHTNTKSTINSSDNENFSFIYSKLLGIVKMLNIQESSPFELIFNHIENTIGSSKKDATLKGIVQSVLDSLENYNNSEVNNFNIVENINENYNMNAYFTILSNICKLNEQLYLTEDVETIKSMISQFSTKNKAITYPIIAIVYSMIFPYDNETYDDNNNNNTLFQYLNKSSDALIFLTSLNMAGNVSSNPVTSKCLHYILTIVEMLLSIPLNKVHWLIHSHALLLLYDIVKHFLSHNEDTEIVFPFNLKFKSLILDFMEQISEINFGFTKIFENQTSKWLVYEDKMKEILKIVTERPLKFNNKRENDLLTENNELEIEHNFNELDLVSKNNNTFNNSNQNVSVMLALNEAASILQILSEENYNNLSEYLILKVRDVRDLCDILLASVKENS